MNKFLSKAFILLTVFIFLLSFANFISCSKHYKEKLIKEKRFLFDSFFEIILIVDNQKQANNDLNNLFENIEKIGSELDWRNNNSIINNSIKDGILTIPDSLFNLFEKVKYYYNFTEGYFNPFLRKLVMAYNNFSEGTVPPDEKNIQNILKIIKKSQIDITEDKKIIVKEANNLDLGAAVAGFLVDYCYNYLLEKGYKNFLVNGSGEIRVSGTKFGKNWFIGIQSPYSNDIIKTLYLPQSYSISTTGSYERFFIYNDVKYHHILNPFTGKPDSKLDSVSIVSKNSCLEADILSTAIFAMGIEKSIQFCKENNIDYYIVYKNGDSVEIKYSSFFND